MFFRTRAQAGRGPFNQERSEALTIYLREDGEQVSEAGVGDELLRSGQAVAAVRLQDRLRLCGEGVAAEPGSVSA